MSKKETPVELIPDTKVKSGWKVKHGTKEGTNPDPTAPDAYPKLDYPEDSGPHLIVFTLPKNGPTFNKDNPIAIQGGTQSPAPDAGLDAQFPDWEIFDGGKTLVVLNRNSKDADYMYAVKADGSNVVLDPIITNGGGTQPPPPPPSGGGTGFMGIDNSAILILFAAIVAFALGFLLGRRR